MLYAIILNFIGKDVSCLLELDRDKYLRLQTAF